MTSICGPLRAPNATRRQSPCRALSPSAYSLGCIRTNTHTQTHTKAAHYPYALCHHTPMLCESLVCEKLCARVSSRLVVCASSVRNVINSPPSFRQLFGMCSPLRVSSLNRCHIVRAHECTASQCMSMGSIKCLLIKNLRTTLFGCVCVCVSLTMLAFIDPQKSTQCRQGPTMAGSITRTQMRFGSGRGMRLTVLR